MEQIASLARLADIDRQPEIGGGSRAKFVDRIVEDGLPNERRRLEWRLMHYGRGIPKLYLSSIARPVSKRRCNATEASALFSTARLSLVSEREKSSGAESRYPSSRAASASIKRSNDPFGSLAKYLLSILTTFPSANNASRAALRGERFALRTLSSFRFGARPGLQQL
jgi:hypothetical protein